MRRFLTPGWLGLHALAVTLITAFVALGWWQLQRAGEGNMRSWAYALEWPLFAVFVLAMWIKMIHDELTGRTAQDAAAQRGEGADGESRAPAGPAEAVDDDDDPELAAYNRYLERLNAQANAGDGR